MADPASDPSRGPLNEVLRRLYDLPHNDQVEVLRTLGSWLHAAETEENPVDRQVFERARALDDLKKAASWLKLPQDQAPTVAKYKAARQALGLAMSSGQIIRRWERWRTACSALTGRGFVARTEAQRRLSGVGGGRVREYEDYVTALRDWQDRPDMPLSRQSYIAWSKSMTPERERLGERPLPNATSIAMNLAVTWEYAERIATRELDVDKARQLQLEEFIRESGPLELLPLSAAAIMLGISGQVAHTRKSEEDFPPWAAKVGDGHYWYREDLEALRDGHDPPDREPGEANHLIYSTADLAGLLRRTTAGLSANIHARRWHLVPEPAGRAGPYAYWLREDADAWIRKHRPELART